MLDEAVRTGKVAQGTVTTANGSVAATAIPLFSQNTGSTVAAVLVISSLKDVDNAVNAVQRQLLFATVLALGVSLLLGYMASYFIARRLKRIERSAELIAGGDLSAKVPETVEDEIGQLADTFNVMADRLRSAFAQVEYERDRVEVLLNDLSEGVIGVSAEGTITIANPAASILLDEQMTGGRDRRRGAARGCGEAVARLPGGRRLRHDRVRPRRCHARSDHLPGRRRRRLHLHRRAPRRHRAGATRARAKRPHRQRVPRVQDAAVLACGIARAHRRGRAQPGGTQGVPADHASAGRPPAYHGGEHARPLPRGSRFLRAEPRGRGPRHGGKIRARRVPGAGADQGGHAVDRRRRGADGVVRRTAPRPGACGR